jgi:hypothetical protein
LPILVLGILHLPYRSNNVPILPHYFYLWIENKRFCPELLALASQRQSSNYVPTKTAIEKSRGSVKMRQQELGMTHGGLLSHEVTSRLRVSRCVLFSQMNGKEIEEFLIHLAIASIQLIYFISLQFLAINYSKKVSN